MKQIFNFFFFPTHSIAVEQEDSMGVAIFFQTHVEWLDTVRIQLVLKKKDFP